MEITSIFKVAGLCAVLTLASCGGDSGTTAPTTASGTTVTPNTGTVTVNTAPNNVVSIGASGTIAKVADATGKAVFTGLTPGAVDVHVFSADGYSATSYMSVNTANVYDTTANTGGSSVDIYVQTVNVPAGSPVHYYLDDGASLYYGYDFTRTGNVWFDTRGKPVGTTFTGTVYASAGVATSSAGNAVYGQAEVVNLGAVSVTTTAVSGAAQSNLVATFSATPVTPSNLVTVNSVVSPVGLVLANINFFGSVDVSSPVAGGTMTFPDTIASAVIPNQPATWSAYAADTAATKEWVRTGAFALGGSIDIAATLTSFPSAAANQTGATISWAESASVHGYNSINIFSIGSAFSWDIITPSGTTSVTLPTVPAIAMSPLTVGSAYNMDVTSSKLSISYEQIVSTPSSNLQGIAFEFVSATNIPYTR